jgi:glycogen(starch) synthase
MPPLKILYMAGPGDVIGTYRCWRAGEDDPSQVALTYSGQFFSFCRDHGVSAKVIAYHPRRERLLDGEFDIEHRPVPLSTRRGPLFHLGWYWFVITVALTAIWRRCDVLVLMTGSHLMPYWFPRWFGKRVILSAQCVLWPKNVGRRGLWRLIHLLDRSFLQRGASAFISMSHDITAQIDEITGGVHASIFSFVPSYRRTVFAPVRRSQRPFRPFRVLFAGRVEMEKGALDLIEIASSLASHASGNIIIDVAGDGDAWHIMNDAIVQRGINHVIQLHGYCNQSRLIELLNQSHAVIVPTKSAMIEGFNKVVVEAVLAHRPFITSNLCPALNYVREAGIEVPADDVGAYTDAICRLAHDETLYDSLVDASFRLDGQFYDLDQSWAAAFGRVLALTYPEITSHSACVSRQRDPAPTTATLGLQSTACIS